MEKRIFGYARVSSKEQNLDRQVLALKKYVEQDKILVDKASGKDLNREAYQALKGSLGLRAGDVLYITSLDRLSRNKEEIKQELQWFKSHKISLKILDLPTSLIEVPEGQEWIQEMVQNILIEVLASVAQQERITIHQRQREGIEAARKKGKQFGRPEVKIPDGFEEIYLKWNRGEITARKAMQKLGLKRSTFYRLITKYEESV